jgi:flavodoxin
MSKEKNCLFRSFLLANPNKEKGRRIVNILLIYASVYGNTEKIAQAIGEGLAAHGNVTTLPVSEVKPEHLNGLDLLVVGSPTQGFRPLPAIKNWLASLPANKLRGVKVAAFDTRIAVEDVNSPILTPMVKIFGYAAKPIADGLIKKGGMLTVPPEGFYVEGTEGPLKPGELERATGWVDQILVVLVR